MQQIMFY